MFKKKEKISTISNITSVGKIDDENVVKVAKYLVNNFGLDVIVYDVQNKTPFVSYYLVASSKSEFRLKKLIQDAKEGLEKNNFIIDHVEGKNKSKWVLIDAKDLVVQLFTKDEREHVKFDDLYLDCNHVVF